MRTVDVSASDVDGRGDYPLRREFVQQQADAGDVGDGVHRPHLMEMDLGDRSAVHLRLRLRDQCVDGERVGAYLFRQVKVREDVLYLAHPGVAVPLVVMMRLSVPVFVRVGMAVGMFVPMRLFVAMAVFMAMRRTGLHALLLFAVYGDGDVRSRDAAFDAGGGGYRHARKREPVHLLKEGGGVRMELQQRRRQHVARGSHAAVKV